jgi:hypothetical protein
MHGTPLKRQRKLGVRDDDDGVIAFPYMPRVADLPRGWRHFSAAAKIEHLIGLDRCREILSWPLDELDPVRRSMRMQVIRVLLPIGIEALLDGSLGRDVARERDREAVIEELGRRPGGAANKPRSGKIGPRAGEREKLWPRPRQKAPPHTRARHNRTSVPPKSACVRIRCPPHTRADGRLAPEATT